MRSNGRNGMAISKNLFAVSADSPPVMEVRRWLDDIPRTTGLPLLNMSQAAPMSLPPRPLREAVSRSLMEETEAHVYGPVLGLPDLRTEVAKQWSAAYGGEISAGQVGITSGCNQAFAAVASALSRTGDAFIVAAPWYFSNKAWLDICGIKTRILEVGDDLLPSAAEAEALISPEVKAISLITPNNPCGVEYPSGIVREFYELAKSAGIALILDETYRDFDSRTGAPHDLFQDEDWPETFIHLYSFSKAYRITGHRAGAVVASTEFLALVEKCLDAVTVCPNQLAQRAALFGLQHLGEWLKGERLEILERRAAMEAGFRRMNRWRLLGCGAYFAYAEHPFEMDSDAVAKRLLASKNILAIPGTMCGLKRSDGGSGRPERQIRFAFPNIGLEEIADFFKRLAAFEP